MIIETVIGREILDSRGNPTVEAEVILSDGTSAMASVPSGASTGEAEALELRDKDKNRYNGKGVLKAVENIEGVIAELLEERLAIDQREIDYAMIRKDATPNKETLGANAILAVSIAVAKAAAISLGMPLYKYLGGVYAHRIPVPMMNVLNGGAHADNNVDVQEFMIVPIGAESFKEALRMGAETYHALKSLLKEKKLSTAIGDEGGFAPDLKEDEEALELLVKAIEKAGYKAGKDIYLAIDTAASNLYDDETKTYRIGRPRRIDEVISLYEGWISKYPFISIEDGVGEHDREGWIALTKALGGKVQLVADDYVVTNPALFRKAISDRIANAMLIKPNQIGTITETCEAIEIAKRAGYGVVFSHRSGETEDSFLADFAVAVNADFLKTGAPCRMDRLSKYNQLLRIEEELADSAVYAGEEVLRRLKK
ncbi:MAG: phosphopyruvate hydratase [Acidobacteriota bacterium]